MRATGMESEQPLLEKRNRMVPLVLGAIRARTGFVSPVGGGTNPGANTDHGELELYKTKGYATYL